MKTDDISKIIPTGVLSAVSPTVISIYEKETMAWQHIGRTGMRAKTRCFPGTRRSACYVMLPVIRLK
jgi:hypothetical protein